MKASLVFATFAMALTLYASAEAETRPASDAAIKRSGALTDLTASTVMVPAGAAILYVSGSVASPVDAARPDGLGDTATQTRSILSKMKASLEAMGWSLGDIVKLTVFLVGAPDNGGRMDTVGMNGVFQTFFGTPDQPNKPARSTVQVAALGRPAILVEIEAVAAKRP